MMIKELFFGGMAVGRGKAGSVLFFTARKSKAQTG